MNLVKGLEKTIYLTRLDGDTYQIVWNWQPGVLSLEPISRDEYGVIDGWFWLEPETINTAQIEAYSPSITAVRSPSYTGYAIDSIYINGIDVHVTLAYLSDPYAIAASLNSQFAQQLGQDFASAVDVVTVGSENRLRITIPPAHAKNSGIVIREGSVFAQALGFSAGEYFGDLPIRYRPYTEEREYILYRWYSPDLAMPIGKVNRPLNFVAAFDKWVIEHNPRLKLLIDGFAYIMSKLDQEASKLIDQFDLNKVPTGVLEYIAYLFNIDLNLLIKRGNEVEAKELLRSIMRIIHTKGTDASFRTAFRFLGIDATIREFKPSSDIQEEVPATTDIEAFYERFLYRDSSYRNPIINHGTTVPSESDLPSIASEGSIIRVLSSNSFHRYENGSWKLLMPADRIYGNGNDPHSTIAALNWDVELSNKPWVKLPIRTYNNLRLLAGFDVVPQGVYGTGVVETAVPDPYRAWIRALNPQPYDLSRDAILKLIVDGDYIEIDFTDYYDLFNDFRRVTIDEIRQILDQRINNIIITSDGDFIVFKSKRVGHGSSISAVVSNQAFGFTGTESYYIGTKVTDIYVSEGEANITEGNYKIPEVSTVAQTINLGSGVAADGVYELYVAPDGILYLKSATQFSGSLYSGLWDAWVRPDMPANVVKVATIRVENGGIVSIEQEPRQSDYRPNSNLTTEQKDAIRAWMRSMKTASGLSSVASDGPYSPAYYRIGTNAPGEDGLKNELVLNGTPFTDITIDAEFNKLIDKFIELVRPVHVRIIDVLIKTKPYNTYYPLAADRPGSVTTLPSQTGFKGGDVSVYMPGYRNFDVDVSKNRLDVYVVDGSITSSYLFMLSYALNTFTDISQFPTDVQVKLNSVPLTTSQYIIRELNAGDVGTNAVYLGAPSTIPSSQNQFVTTVSNNDLGRFVLELDASVTINPGDILEISYRSPELRYAFELEIDPRDTHAWQFKGQTAIANVNNFNVQSNYYNGSLINAYRPYSQPSNGDTITIAAIPNLIYTATFGTDVAIGATLSDTIDNLVSWLTTQAPPIGASWDQHTSTLYIDGFIRDTSWSGISVYGYGDWNAVYNTYAKNYYSDGFNFQTYTYFDPWRIILYATGLNGGKLVDGNSGVYSIDTLMRTSSGDFINHIVPYFAAPAVNTLGLPQSVNGVQTNNLELAELTLQGISVTVPPTYTLGEPQLWAVAQGGQNTTAIRREPPLFIQQTIDLPNSVPDIWLGSTLPEMVDAISFYDQPNIYSIIDSNYYDGYLYRGKVVDDAVIIKVAGGGQMFRLTSGITGKLLPATADLDSETSAGIPLTLVV